MDINTAAKLLDGCTIGQEISKERETEFKKFGLVVVFGASDDLMEFRGAVHDETGAPGTEYFSPSGLFRSRCEDEDCPYAEEERSRCVKIRSRWCAEPGISWTYETDIVHATFNVMEDGDVYCRGIVFLLEHVGT